MKSVSSILLVFCMTAWAAAENGKPADKEADKDTEKVTYVEHVMPILRQHCFGCHNQDKTEGGLNLTTYTTAMEGGGSGTVVEPGDAASSYLYMLVTHESEPFMPPSSPKLPVEKLAVLEKWISGGALEDAGSKVKIKEKPSYDLAVPAAGAGKPEGPPPMPSGLTLSPVVTTSRASAVTALAASPWAPLVAVAGEKQVLLYNTDTLQLVGVLPFEEGVPHDLKFSRNGKLLLAGGGHAALSGRVVIWDVTTGKRVIVVGEEFDSVLAADISRDQRFIALGGPSKMLRVYSTSTGEKLYEVKKHTEWITAVAFSPDNVLLATADRNGGMHIWEAAGGQEYLTLEGHKQAVTDLSWRIDGNLLASSSEDGSVKLWEMLEGKSIKSINAHGGGVQSVEFAKDGNLVTCGRDKTAKLWNQDGKQLKAFPAFGDVALEVAITHDNARVIAGDWLGDIRVFAAADGQQVGTLRSNPPSIEQLLASAKSDLEQHQTELAKLTDAMKASEAAHSQAAAAHATAEKKVADLNGQMAKAKADVEEGKKQLGQAEPTVARLQPQIEPLKAAVEQLKGAVDQAAKADGNGKPEAASSEHIKKFHELVASSNSALQSATAKLNEAKSAQEAAKQQVAAAEQMLKSATDELAKVQPQLADLKKKVDEAQQKLNADKDAVAKATQKVDESKANVEKLNEQMASQTASSDNKPADNETANVSK